MSYIKYHVVHYQNTSETTWDTEGQLVDAYDVKVNTAIGDKRNNFQFKIININDQFSTLFDPNEKVEIYRTLNSDTYTSEDLLMVGVIQEAKKTLDGDKEIIMVKGYDYSEAVLGAIVFFDGSGQNVMQMMQQMVNSINSKNGVNAANQKYHLTLDAPSNKYNPTTGLYDGDSFPIVETAYEFYKTGLKVIEKYLNANYTEDGRYYWYVSTDNKLVIRKRTDDVDESGGQQIVINEAQDCYGVEIGVDNKDVKNFIIWKGGFDPSNKVIMGYSDNPTSRVKHGSRFHFLLTDDVVTQPLFEGEKNSNPEGTFEVSSKMLASSSYPYTTTWTSSGRDATNAPTIANVGDNVVCTNASEWVYAFRREVKWKSQRIADDIAQNASLGYLKISCELPHSSTYQVGQLLLFNSARYGYVNKKLRVNEISYDINSMTLSLQEDIGTI